MVNSTLISDKKWSNQLKSVSPVPESKHKKIEKEDFIKYDKDNLFRSSYKDAVSYLPSVVNSHYIPNYQGFVPRIKSENGFGKCTSIIADRSIREFIFKSDVKDDLLNKKEISFNPISRSYGSKKELLDKIKNHSVNTSKRETGYTLNNAICDGRGWTPDKILHSKF